MISLMFEEIKSLITSVEKKLMIKLVPREAVYSLIVLLLMFSVSFIGNVYQIREINQMNDNDIKYRYIKTANGITPEDLYKLENIFNYNRDKKVIKEIRKVVEDYEGKIRETAEKIERDRLKESGSKN